MSYDQLVQATVTVYGDGEGSGSWSDKLRTQKIDQWCNENQQYSKSTQDSTTHASNVFEPSVAAWAECKKLYARGAHVATRFGPNNSSFSVNLTYTGGTSGMPLYRILTKEFTCRAFGTDNQTQKNREITATELDKGVLIGPEAIAISCDRTPPKPVNIGGQQYRIAPEGYVNIMTSDESPLRFDFQESADFALPVQKLDEINRTLVDIRNSIGDLTNTVNNLSTRMAASEAAQLTMSGNVKSLQTDVDKNKFWVAIGWREGNNGSLTCDVYCRNGPPTTPDSGVLGNCLGARLHAGAAPYSCSETAKQPISCLCAQARAPLP